MHIFILSKFIVGSNFGAVILKFYILQDQASIGGVWNQVLNQGKQDINVEQGKERKISVFILMLHLMTF